MNRRKIGVWLLAGAAVLFLGSGLVARAAVSAGVRAVTGLQLGIQRMEVGLFRSRVSVQGVRLNNPKGFPDRVMADLPELEVDYDLPAFLRGKVHLEELRVNLRELVVVRNAQGELNLDSLTAVRQAKARKGSPERKEPKVRRSFQIDRLHLQVGKVIYKDYSRGQPSVQEFIVNLDERHENIRRPEVLGALIVSRALVKTTVARLASFDLAALEGQLRGAVERAGQAASEAAERIRGILPLE